MCLLASSSRIVVFHRLNQEPSVALEPMPDLVDFGRVSASFRDHTLGLWNASLMPMCTVRVQ